MATSSTRSTVDEAAPAVPAPRRGQLVDVAVHPDVHNGGRDDVVTAVITRVVPDDQGEYRVDVLAFTTEGTRAFTGVRWHPHRDAHDQAEAEAAKLLPGKTNPRTLDGWATHDVREWETGAWPVDTAGA